VAAVWLSGNIVGCTTTLLYVQLGLLRYVTVLGCTVLVFNQVTQANSALVIPLWIGKMNSGDGYGYH